MTLWDKYEVGLFLEIMITIIKLIASLNNGTMGEHVMKRYGKYRGLERNCTH